MRVSSLVGLCLGLLFLAGCPAHPPGSRVAALPAPTVAGDRELDRAQYQTASGDGFISFTRNVQPILENRCVVCHGCYDAPCQLKLESAAGIDRGASKQPVYDGGRLRAVAPTRLHIDAKTTAEWRGKGFHPVLNEGPDTPEANVDQSLLAQMLRLKQIQPQPASGPLPSDFDFALNRRLECPTREEFDRFAKQHPKWGMPYGFPGLRPEEHATLLAWLRQGARYPGPAPLPAATLAEVQHWENLLNGSSLKERLVARYLYEHLFIGHLHFQGHPDREFFRLVRSRTPPGQPVEEIATVKPYDDPGPNRFYYRLGKVCTTAAEAAVVGCCFR